MLIAPARPLTALLLALTVTGGLLAASPRLLAGDPPADPPLVIYTMNERGLLSIGGTVIENLVSKYDPSKDPPVNPEQQWVQLAIDGGDRWALRADGRIHQNGKKLHVLPFDSLDPTNAAVWRRLAHSDALYALRSDGLVAVDGVTDVQYPAQSFTFIDVVAPPTTPFSEGPALFALRSDGAIFGGTDQTPGMMMVGGPGVEITPGAGGSLDGAYFDTTWTSLAVDPVSGLIHGLRADGRVLAFDDIDFDASSGVDPGAGPTDGGAGGTEGSFPPTATPVANFPFPDDPLFTFASLYTEIAFDDDGTFFVLRQDGAVFHSSNEVDPLIDLPGDGLDPDEVFVDFDVHDGQGYALRYDGQLYGNAGTSIIDLQKKAYRSLALSTAAPDLSNFKNTKPVAALYKPLLVEDKPINLPIIITDVNLPAEDLDIQVDLTDLPGATWNPNARLVGWAGGPAGKYSFTVSAEDGQLKKPKTFKYKIKVVPADTVPEKNRPPSLTKVKKVQALVGHELVLPVFASDRDGDPLTMTVDEEKGIFALGATFDPMTNTISWTPAFDDLGKQSAVVMVSDGTKTKKLKVKVNVLNPLIFE